MDLVEQIQLVGQLVGASLTVALSWYKLLKPYLAKRTNEKTLEARVAQKDALARWLRDMGAARTMLISVSNGSKPLHPTSQFEVSILAEELFNGTRSIKADWQGRIMDSDFVQMLAECKAREVIHLDPKEMPRYSYLRDHYESIGTVASVVGWVGTDDDGFIIISAHFDGNHQTEGMGASVRNKTRRCLGVMQKLMPVRVERR